MEHSFLIESELDNKTGTIRRYTYVENKGNIYKLEVWFKYMDLVDLIEHYIECISDCDFEVKCELDVENEGLVKKYFPFQGKYRLKGNFKATNNYLVPCDTKLLKILFEVYSKNILEELNLLRVKEEYKKAYDSNDEVVKKFIIEFLSNVNFSLIGKYTIEEIRNCLDCLDKISMETKYSRTHVHLSKILSTSKKNAAIFELLNLNDKFIKFINEPEEENDKAFCKVRKKHK